MNFPILIILNTLLKKNTKISDVISAQNFVRSLQVRIWGKLRGLGTVINEFDISECMRYYKLHSKPFFRNRTKFEYIDRLD